LGGGGDGRAQEPGRFGAVPFEAVLGENHFKGQKLGWEKGEKKLLHLVG